MATTKIITMHKRNGKSVATSLKEILDYGKNPDKTQNGELISCFECCKETVDAEWTLSKSEYFHLTGRINRNDIICYQLRQSFMPGEITPEEANKVGFETARRLLNDSYSFIVCTHVDKHHIHNHIYFNSVALNCTHKFNDEWFISKGVAELSDLVCTEHNLSVIEHDEHIGTSYVHWKDANNINSRITLREILKANIDEIFKNEKPKSFESFLTSLKDRGYSIKCGKYISVKGEGQQKYIRLKSLGEDYSEEMLRKTINGQKTKPKYINNYPHLIIDIQKAIASGKGPGYQQWIKVYNLKTKAATFNYIQDSGFKTYDEFYNFVENERLKIKELTTIISEKQLKMDELSKLKSNVVTYANTINTFKEFEKLGYDGKFYNEHKEEIELFRAAGEYFKSKGYTKSVPGVKTIDEQWKALLTEKKSAINELNRLKPEHKKNLIHLENLGVLLDEKNKSGRILFNSQLNTNRMIK